MSLVERGDGGDEVGGEAGSDPGVREGGESSVPRGARRFLSYKRKTTCTDC
jgi:hypothetical protein